MKKVFLLFALCLSFCATLVSAQTDAEKTFQRRLARAQKGYVADQYKVGVCYLRGNGVAKNETESFKWILKAANLEYTIAQNAVGVFYMNGTGVEKNINEAIKWFKLAADNYDEMALYHLGNIYYEGEGVAKDYKAAFGYYMRAAQLGDGRSQYMIGLMYYHGLGTSKDHQSAYNWLKMAEASGVKTDNIILATLENTPEIKKQQIELTVDVDKAIPPTNIANNNTYAIIIGNENYQNVTKVKYALNDAKTFNAYCTTTLGLPTANIKMVQDGSYNNMMKALTAMKTKMSASAGTKTLLFYYAGHGFPDDSTKDAYLLPVDQDQAALDFCISTTSLYNTLASMGAERTIVFLDACFSGSQRGEGMLQSARAVAIKPKKSTPVGNMIVFTASSGEETAYPLQSARHGLFTYYVLRHLQTTRGTANIGAIVNYVTTNVKKESILKNNKLQTPTLLLSPQIGEKWRTWSLLPTSGAVQKHMNFMGISMNCDLNTFSAQLQMKGFTPGETGAFGTMKYAMLQGKCPLADNADIILFTNGSGLMARVSVTTNNVKDWAALVAEYMRVGAALEKQYGKPTSDNRRFASDAQPTTDGERLEMVKQEMCEWGMVFETTEGSVETSFGYDDTTDTYSLSVIYFDATNQKQVQQEMLNGDYGM